MKNCVCVCETERENMAEKQLDKEERVKDGLKEKQSGKTEKDYS